MKRGIRINARGIWFLSESHTDMDIESTLSVASEVLQSMAL
jgi:glutamate-1-semialdehyde aminotransferase